MKKIIILIYLIFFSSIFFIGCSELEDSITSVSKPGIHGEGVLNINSPNFHGKYFDKLKFRDCQNCHAKYFQGGLTPVNCADANCHPAVKIHADTTGVLNQSSSNFHGRYLLTNNFVDCQQCHGENFTGGLSSPSCVTCHSAIGVHKTGIVDEASPNFHGKNPLSAEFINCQQCHGDNFTGGISSPSCVTCHSAINVHKSGIIDTNSPNFHGEYLKSIHWNISECASCHNTTFTGGIQSPTCKTSGCHNSANGPEECNTCHGNFNDPSIIAPPRDLSGNTLTTFKGVGAHANHLYNNVFGNKVDCESCHNVPQSFNSAGHLDGNLPAEINFKGLATFNAASNANYDFSSLTCANVYCHGNFEYQKDSASISNQFAYLGTKIEGNKRSVIWNKVDGSEIVCGTCHGLPPTGHVNFGGLSSCVNCHIGVVNAQGQIIDKTKHINGVKNVFGN